MNRTSPQVSILSHLPLQSQLTHIHHVFLGLPLLPGSFIFLQADIQTSSSLRSTCPDHLSRPLLTTSKTSPTPSRIIKFYALILSCSETSHIHLAIALSTVSSWLTSSTSIAQVSLPYNSTLCTHAL